MGKRVKWGAAVVAAAFGAVIAVGTPASASDEEFWTRSCGSKYYAFSDEYTAWTKKYSGGDCAGDAWVRVKVGTKWSDWLHASGKATLNQEHGYIVLSEHKGCSTCKVYTLIP